MIRLWPRGAESATAAPEMSAPLRELSNVLQRGRGGSLADAARNIENRARNISNVQGPEAEQLLRDNNLLRLRALQQENRLNPGRAAHIQQEIREINQEMAGLTGIAATPAGSPAIDNVAAGHSDPTVQALGAQMSRIEAMLRGMPGGAVGGTGMHPMWMAHPMWSVGGYGGAPGGGRPYQLGDIGPDGTPIVAAGNALNEQRIREIFAEELAKHKAATDAQLQAQNGDPNIKHISEGLQKIGKGRWFRAALVAAGIAGTTAILTGSGGFAAPVVPYLMNALLAWGASSTVATVGTGAAVGAGVFTPLWAMRGVGRTIKADRALRREYGNNIYVSGKLRQMLFKEPFKGALLGGVIGALLGYPYPGGKTGAEYVKGGALNVWKDPWTLWTTPKGWLSWLWSNIPWPTSSPDCLRCSPGIHFSALTEQLNFISPAVAAEAATAAAPASSWPVSLGSVGLGAAGGMALNRLTTPKAAALDAGAEAVKFTPEAVWKDAKLTPAQKNTLTGFANTIMPGETDMRKIVEKVSNRDLGSDLLLAISRSGWSPPEMEQAMIPLRKLRNPL
ncbi:MAG: hypothetical protein G01um10148_1059 [Parcubacteria group bacterium Gr01-1014_8]|nr:MAG: hypothetical protein G01um10148_1059 [Parcubacteria group bacterium Gr01-1014_8]